MSDEDVEAILARTTALQARQEDDVSTLVSTIEGTLLLSDYSQDQMDEVWVRVKRKVEKWIGERT